jgi:hypothetical protein
MRSNTPTLNMRSKSVMSITRNWRRPLNARVVDQDIETAEFLQDARNHLPAPRVHGAGDGRQRCRGIADHSPGELRLFGTACGS